MLLFVPAAVWMSTTLPQDPFSNNLIISDGSGIGRVIGFDRRTQCVRRHGLNQ